MAKHTSTYTPNPLFIEKRPSVSGNTVNGLDEQERRQASPFFWHKPDLHAFGELQQTVTDYHRRSPEVANTYSPRNDRGPKPIQKVSAQAQKSPAEWTSLVKEFALANEGNLVGIARMQPEWVYEGYAITDPWVIVIGVAMDHERLNQVPLSSTGHRNTSLKFICGRTEIQSFPGPLVQAQCYLVQL